MIWQDQKLFDKIGKALKDPKTYFQVNNPEM